MEKSVREKITDRFGTVIKEEYVHNDRRTYITVDKTDVPMVCRFLHSELGGRLCIATATDLRGGYEILYHFMFPSEYQLVTVKTKISKTEPEIESVGAFYKAAEWIEREMNDIMGITFKNHPDPRRILMADSWPADMYPLRRDFCGLDEERAKYGNPGGDGQ